MLASRAFIGGVRPDFIQSDLACAIGKLPDDPVEFFSCECRLRGLFCLSPGGQLQVLWCVIARGKDSVAGIQVGLVSD